MKKEFYKQLKKYFLSKTFYLTSGLGDIITGYFFSSFAAMAKDNWNYYYNSSFRSDANTLSSVGTFFTTIGIIFIVAFCIALFLEKMGYVCPHCGMRYLPMAKICLNCKKTLSPQEHTTETHITCKACNTMCPSHANNCYNCGESLKDNNPNL